MRNHMKKLTLLLAVCAMAAVASPAWAAPGDEGYKSGGEDVAGQLQGGDQGAGQAPGANQGGGDVAGTTAETGQGGSLPFTGLDVALILGVGGVLLAVGLGTRRLTRQPDAV